MRNVRINAVMWRTAIVGIGLLLLIGCSSEQGKTTISTGSTGSTNPSTTLPTTTTLVAFDQGTADSIMKERFGTSTTTTSGFVPTDPSDEDLQRLILMAGLTLDDTRFSIDAVGTDQWASMLRDGSVAACEILFSGGTEPEALGSALSRVPGIDVESLGERDPDVFPLALVYLTDGIGLYCPDLWTVNVGSDGEAERLYNIWAELVDLPSAEEVRGSENDLADAEEGLRQAIITDLESRDFERVELLTFDEGEMVIEGRLRWASEDRQQPSHFASVEYIADTFTEQAATVLIEVFGTDTPDLAMRTTSTDGDYHLTSVTSWDLLEQIQAREVSASGWWDEAGQ